MLLLIVAIKVLPRLSPCPQARQVAVRVIVTTVQEGEGKTRELETIIAFSLFRNRREQARATESSASQPQNLARPGPGTGSLSRLWRSVFCSL